MKPNFYSLSFGVRLRERLLDKSVVMRNPFGEKSTIGHLLGGDAGLGVIIGVMSLILDKIGISHVGLVFFIITLFV